MKITFEILAFVLKKNIVFEEIRSLNLDIRGIRLFASGHTFRKDILYIADLRDGDFFRTGRPVIENLYSFPLNLLFLTGKKHVDEKGLRLACSMYAQIKETDNFAVLETSWDAEEILTKLERIIYDLNEWDSSFDRDILLKTDNEKLFSRGRRYLPYRYGIFDRDMRIIYDTYVKSDAQKDQMQDLSDDTFRDLILHRDFHEAALSRKPFYYRVVYADALDYCFNFYVNGEYMARLLIILPPGMNELHEGAKQIFLIFAGHIQNIFDYGNYVFGRHSNDSMHRLLSDLANGKGIADETIRADLGSYGWSENSIFAVAVISFYSEEGWGSNPQTALPYLAMKFEKELPFTCTIIDRQEIIMLVNRGQSGRSCENRDFLEKIAVLVRDNICRAGISPDFTDLNKTSGAVLAARHALKIGTERQPHFWYYLFDNLKLPYITELCRSEIPAEFVCHSALDILEKYDGSHGSDYYLTLKALIKYNLNVSAAADSLSVHRSTFLRRMDKIRELTGTDTSDPDTILLLALSYKIKDDP